MMILESREHAERRGAAILARVTGVGSSFGRRSRGLGVTVAAISRSISIALDSAGAAGDALSHVNAHGLSTQEDDTVEAAAIREILGDVPVTALKSLFGNLGAGSGSVELIASILGMNEGVIPRTRNYETPDPSCPVQIVTEPTTSKGQAVLALNQSRLGATAAVVIEKA